MRSAPAEKHLLLIADGRQSRTTATGFRPTERMPLSREYDGQAGVEDTAGGGAGSAAAGVSGWRRSSWGSRPASRRRMPDLRPKDLARIRRMDQLAAGGRDG